MVGHLIDIVPCLGGGLNIRHLPLSGTVATRVQRYLPPLREVRLVPHQQERNVLVVLHTQDLLPETVRSSL